jgi:hypothetical protein
MVRVNPLAIKITTTNQMVLLQLLNATMQLVLHQKVLKKMVHAQLLIELPVKEKEFFPISGILMNQITENANS